MEYVKAMNYTGFNYQCIGEEKAKENLRLMKQKTACNTVIIVLGALQDEPSDTYIDYHHEIMPKDTDLMDFIRYARELGLNVFLKPVVDCRNGCCRADIRFTRHGELEEEEWQKWFRNYTEFVLHYAVIAQKMNCELYFIGCRLLKLESMTESWMALAAKVREIYHGLITYEADIYNEENVAFWDVLDLIASGGNYSKLYLEQELVRLTELASKHQKTLLLTECGCMSTKGAAISPNAWEVDGELSLQEQVVFFNNLLKLCRKQPLLSGLGIWCWNNRRMSERSAMRDKRYFIYGKPACNVLYEEWKEN